jgi:hypothetical protein
MARTVLGLKPDTRQSKMKSTSTMTVVLVGMQQMSALH